jgi:DNA repair photolyase
MSDQLNPGVTNFNRANVLPIFPTIEVPEVRVQNYGPIESKMREVLAAIKDSKYPDSFDWTIYDKIAARYGEGQPRGGVVFNTTLKIANFHSSCSKCHYAFEIDTYGRGCIHNCIYCYAKRLLSVRGFWNRPMPFPINMAEVRKIFYTVFETSRPSKWREIMEKRVPLRIGSMSDSFMWTDQKYGVTKELLKILKFYQYPYIVFTRSDLVATQEYMDLLDERLASIQMSISGGNEQLTRTIEPGAPSVKRRFAALKVLGESGFWTTVRINPLFPIYPDGYFTNPDSIRERFGSPDNCPKFELFDWSFIEQIKEAKVPSVLAGFVRLSPWAVNNLTKETGIDFRSFFTPEKLKEAGDKRFSDSEIAYYYKKIQAECAKHRIRFSTCYIGNGEKDYYQYQSLWSNKSDCCDARGNVGAIESSSQEISWETRLKQAPCKKSALEAKKREEEFDLRFSKARSRLSLVPSDFTLQP